MKKKLIVLWSMIIIIVIVICILVAFNKGKNKEVEKETSENTVEEENTEVISLEYVESMETGILQNNSKKLKNNKKIDNLEITRINLTADSNNTTLILDVKNITKTMQGNKNITLVFKDKDENELGKIGLHIKEIPAGETITIEIKASKEIINTYDFDILDEGISF